MNTLTETQVRLDALLAAAEKAKRKAEELRPKMEQARMEMEPLQQKFEALRREWASAYVENQTLTQMASEIQGGAK